MIEQAKSVVAITTEHVMRCEVTGGYIEVRYGHAMTAEDLDDLAGYVAVWRSHLAKREQVAPIATGAAG